jgi:hypothetical protein
MITKKTGGSILAVCLLGVSMSAFAGKPCEELKSEIDTKFQAKGVKNFTLDIVTNGAEDTGRSAHATVAPSTSATSATVSLPQHPKMRSPQRQNPQRNKRIAAR